MLVEDEVRAASAKAATTHYDRSLKEYAESKDARDRHGQADEGSSLALSSFHLPLPTDMAFWP